MARGRTLADLRTDVLDICEMDPGDFVTTALVDRRINESASALHSRLATKLGREYLFEEAMITVAPNASIVIMPVDMAHVCGVYFLDGSEWRSMIKFSGRSLHQDAVRWSGKNIGYKPENFSGEDQKIRFSMPTSGAQDIRVGYVPAWTDLVDDADTFYLPNDWHTWVMYEASMKMKVKEDTAIKDLLILQSKYEREIDAAIAAVDYENTDVMDPQDGVWGSWEGMY